MTGHWIGTHLAWMGNAITPRVFSVLALGEWINDKLLTTPSRKIPPQFIARIVSGALSGAVSSRRAGFVGDRADRWSRGRRCCGNAVGGAAVRGSLAAAFGKDPPAALLEDVVAIGLAIAVVAQV